MHDQVEALIAVAPDLVERLRSVRGIEGVLLGGSRSRGTHTSTSDYDLGLYYRGDLDVPALQQIANSVSDEPAQATMVGGWGPWVNGGAWMVIDGTQIDLIYRDLDRVHGVWSDCVAGRFTNEHQAGHPLGFWSHAYAGELALGVATGDLSSEMAALKIETAEYPPRLAAALIEARWEASFSVSIARKAVDRGDVSYVAGALFRAVGVLTHALHGHGRCWLLNEKGAVASAATMPGAPSDFDARVDAAFGALSSHPDHLERACVMTQSIVDDVDAAIT